MTKTKKSQEEERAQRDRMRSEVVGEIAALCRVWILRSLSATSGGETHTSLFHPFMKAWAIQIVQDKLNPLSASNLAVEVADVMLREGKADPSAINEQCESVAAVWRAWVFFAGPWITQRDAKTFCERWEMEGKTALRRIDSRSPSGVIPPSNHTG